VTVGRPGNDILLDSRQPPRRFWQRQTQPSDIAKTIRPVELLGADISVWTTDPGSNQLRHPFRPRAPSRQINRPVTRTGHQTIFAGSPRYSERMNAMTFQIWSGLSASFQEAMLVPSRPLVIVRNSVASVGL